jgi:hypothetical protein
MDSVSTWLVVGEDSIFVLFQGISEDEGVGMTMSH